MTDTNIRSNHIADCADCQRAADGQSRRNNPILRFVSLNVWIVATVAADDDDDDDDDDTSCAPVTWNVLHFPVMTFLAVCRSFQTLPQPVFTVMTKTTATGWLFASPLDESPWCASNLILSKCRMLSELLTLARIYSHLRRFLCRIKSCGQRLLVLTAKRRKVMLKCFLRNWADALENPARFLPTENAVVTVSNAAGVDSTGRLKTREWTTWKTRQQLVGVETQE